MKQLLFIILTLISCGQAKLSDIEVIKIDLKMISELEQNSDTTIFEKLNWEDVNFFSLEYLIKHQSKDTTKIYRDSLGGIVAISTIKNHEEIFIGEYFPNGQLKGKLPRDDSGTYNGLGRYYYEDGRVSTEGYWRNGYESGNWKNYNKDGKLVSITENYTDNSGGRRCRIKKIN